MLDSMGISNILIALVVLCSILGVALLVTAIMSLRRRRIVPSTIRLLLSLTLITCAASFAIFAIGAQEYRALTHETLAAIVYIRPLERQRFLAIIHLPGGQVITRTIDGDEFYIDAHVLKWKPIANLIGLHTAYALDRFGGRYQRLKDEQHDPRTVYGFNADSPLDLFDLRQRYAWLSPLFDAEYGSASFVPANQRCKLEVLVSTTGLLIRRFEDPQKTQME